MSCNHQHDNSNEAEENNNEVITRQAILHKCADFDMESVRFLNLSNSRVTTLHQDITLCVNLVELKLANNAIENIDVLGKLEQIEMLDISSNKITNINPLVSMSRLSNLKVAGNRIKSVDCLKCLQNLKKIRLSDQLLHLSNPVCRKDTGYPQSVVNQLNQIIELDGLRVRGVGSTFYHLVNQVEKECADDNEQGGDVTPIQTRHHHHYNINNTGGDWFRLDEQPDVTSSVSLDGIRSRLAAAKRNFENILKESHRICEKKN